MRKIPWLLFLFSLLISNQSIHAQTRARRVAQTQRHQRHRGRAQPPVLSGASQPNESRVLTEPAGSQIPALRRSARRTTSSAWTRRW